MPRSDVPLTPLAMCDFFAFRNKAIDTFASLIVSVSMSEDGSGVRENPVIYKVEVSGMAIGSRPLSSQGVSADEVLRSLIGQVGRARREVKAAREIRETARRTGQFAAA